jgi:anthranilate synthase component II
MVLLIDNYDSFTYNLVQYFRELGEEVKTFFNDKITVDEIISFNPSHIVLSPGPGRPEQAGVTLSVIKYLYNKIPILGVCLGHQAIGLAFGARIIPAKQLMHGKTSLIYHRQKSVFDQISPCFTAMRYHSLAIDQETLPEDLVTTAWTQDPLGEISDIMGIQHRDYPLVGVQFHPESVATQYGHQLLKNFLRQTV